MVVIRKLWETLQESLLALIYTTKSHGSAIVPYTMFYKVTQRLTEVVKEERKDTHTIESICLNYTTYIYLLWGCEAQICKKMHPNGTRHVPIR